jgi:glutamyl-tRNA reductase
MDESLLIVGVNHRTAPVAIRERLTYAKERIVTALGRLRERAPALAEAALISTCNRVEIIGVATDPTRAGDEAIGFLAADRELDAALFAGAVYRFAGRDAARHLFRVGASLDSMVVGETQILGQLKLAYLQAAEAGSVGLVLHRAFHRTFSVAKRVRKTTLIGRGSVSVSSAAVHLAGQIFETLVDKTVLLMGSGQMAELTARQLHARGVGSLLVTSRTFDHAVALARTLGGIAVPFENYRQYLKVADIVIGSLAAARPVLEREEFEILVRERHYRPMFLIDLGVPRNFDGRLNVVDNVYLYDIDDLGAVVSASRGERAREAEKAEAIVAAELDSFMRWMNGLDLIPAIKDIRVSIEHLREGELGRHGAWLASLEPAERARIESLTHALVNKLLHRILSGLRSTGSTGPDPICAAEVARRLLCGDRRPMLWQSK